MRPRQSLPPVVGLRTAPPSRAQGGGRRARRDSGDQVGERPNNPCGQKRHAAGQRVAPTVPRVSFGREVCPRSYLAAGMGTTFGVLALILATIGLYSVMTYAVSQRTREIGIRMALGAQVRDMLRLIVSQGMRMVLIGIVLGLAGAFALTRALGSLLLGIGTTDPVTFVGVAVLLIAVALLACYIPALRAARVDPLVALRHE